MGLLMVGDVGRFRRLCQYDFSAGRSRFLIGLAVYLGVLAVTFVRFRLDLGNVGLAPSACELLFRMLSGSEPYVVGLSSVFSLPVSWFALQLAVAFSIGFYPASMFGRDGASSALHAGSLGLWWLSKTVWVVVHVAMLYGVSVIVAWILSDASMPACTLRLDVCSFGCDLSVAPTFSLFAQSFVLQVSLSILFALAQVAISFFVGAPFALLAFAGFLVVSCFASLPLLGADAAMLLRWPAQGLGWMSFVGRAGLYLTAAFAIIASTARALSYVDFGMVQDDR